MKTIETTAKTTEEAIEIALKELDAERGEVEIDVVSQGKSGILGLGSEPARVRVTLLESDADPLEPDTTTLESDADPLEPDTTPDIVEVTSDILDNLISKMGVSVIATLQQVEREDLGGPVFEIEGDDSGLLIGRKGETLRSLQFIVKFLVSRQLGDQVNLLIDVEGYQDRRYKALENLAQRVARSVAKSRRPITLEPMPPNERRAVHMALADDSEVITESTGFGDNRQVVIKPR